MKHLSLLLTTALILALAACGAPEAGQSPTAAPSAAPTWTPRPTVAPQPIATPAPTELPIATYTAELSATVTAGLPPTATPQPGEGGFAPGISGVGVLPLREAGRSDSLWAVFSVGMHAFDPPQYHFVAIYTRDGAGWRELDRVELEQDDYLDEGGVTQVQLDPRSIWLEVQGGAGAHAGCYDLLRFDGQKLHDELSGCSASPGAGYLQDLNGDGTPEVVLDATDHYVFCYACGVRLVNYQVQRWDGQKMVEVKLQLLPESAPAELRALTHQAVELAQAGFWKDAQATISQTLGLGCRADPAGRRGARRAGRQRRLPAARPPVLRRLRRRAERDAAVQAGRAVRPDDAAGQGHHCRGLGATGDRLDHHDDRPGAPAQARPGGGLLPAWLGRASDQPG